MRIMILNPMVIEEFANYERLGRIALRNHNRTVAVGIAKVVCRR